MDSGIEHEINGKSIVVKQALLREEMKESRITEESQKKSQVKEQVVYDSNWYTKPENSLNPGMLNRAYNSIDVFDYKKVVHMDSMDHKSELESQYAWTKWADPMDTKSKKSNAYNQNSSLSKMHGSVKQRLNKPSKKSDTNSQYGPPMSTHSMYGYPHPPPYGYYPHPPPYMYYPPQYFPYHNNDQNPHMRPDIPRYSHTPDEHLNYSKLKCYNSEDNVPAYAKSMTLNQEHMGEHLLQNERKDKKNKQKENPMSKISRYSSIENDLLDADLENLAKTCPNK